MAWVTNLVINMKLSTKISVLMVCMVTVSGLLVGFLSVETTTKSFDEYILKMREVQLGEWADNYTKYYENNNNSWEGVEYYRHYSTAITPFMIVSSKSSVVLADRDGFILYHPESAYIGKKLSEEIMRRGLYLQSHNEFIGVLLPMDYFDPRFWALEENFAQKVAKAAVKGTFFTSLFAVVLGLAMSQHLVIPLKSLTSAVKRMAKNHFDEPLPVYSNDEIGELSTAFNIMAHEIDENMRLRRQMFADISHELRTPLTVLGSKLEMTLERNEPLDPVETAMLYDEVIRLKGLVQELQDLSKLEAGQVVLNKTLIDFGAYFSDFFVLLAAEAEDRQITLTMEQSPSVKYCYADSQRLRQIVLNLVNNALRYTPEGGEVSLRAFEEGDDFVFEVEDNGVGISEDDLPYIFQRFYRADKSRDRATGGSGLGLAITKGFVEAHQGTITVRSTLGKGTIFTVRLPQYHEKETTEK